MRLRCALCGDPTPRQKRFDVFELSQAVKSTISWLIERAPIHNGWEPLLIAAPCLDFQPAGIRIRLTSLAHRESADREFTNGTYSTINLLSLVIVRLPYQIKSARL